MSLIARACPGLFTEDFIRFHLPQERGWAYIHAWQVEAGQRVQWRDDRNPGVQWWQDIKQKLSSLRTEER